MALKALLLGARGAHVVNSMALKALLMGARGAHDLGTPLKGAHAAVTTTNCKKTISG